jgi:putative Ca2+/H+ antiporter (TMEM165/GDT1 family)
MNSLVAVLAASLTTFAATNIDDVFLLTLFFARRVPTRRIVAGQYLGFAAIIVVSLIGVWAALAIPHRWIRVLGLLPLAIGIKGLFQIRRTEPKKSSLDQLQSYINCACHAVERSGQRWRLCAFLPSEPSLSLGHFDRICRTDRNLVLRRSMARQPLGYFALG